MGEVHDALARQERSRLGGHAVLTLLAGPPAATRAAWREPRWTAGRRALVVEDASADARELDLVLCEAVLPASEWPRRVDAYLRREPARAPGSLAHLRALGHDELALALAQRGEDELLAEALRAVAVGQGSVARMLRRCGDDAGRLWERVLGPLLADDPPPALALATARPEVQWLTAVARWAASWLQLAPRLAIGILMPSWDRQLAQAPHLEALLREGAIEVAAPAPLAPSDDEPIVPSDPANADGARSAAERFLHGCLEARASTRGRFVLNQRLAATASAPACEIDLAASDLGLAIELDGYHHFREPEDYRRDRRKDLALQRRGFWVLRFLSDDVVTHLESILETIDAAIAARQGQGAPDR